MGRYRQSGLFVASAGRALLELGRYRASGVDERAANRLDVRRADGLAVVARPLVRAAGGLERALEARHDVAREQLVGAQGLLARRPLVCAEEQAAEAAAALPLQMLDALHDRLDRADQGRAHLHA